MPDFSILLGGSLQLGSGGSEVLKLQQQLNSERLGPNLTADGRFGKRTHDALIAFQRRKGLTGDGVVGPKTAQKLGWKYTGRTAPPYVIRYDRPPLPGDTPPLRVLGDAIRAGLESYKELILAEVPKTGLTVESVGKVNRDIENFYEGLMQSVDTFTQTTRFKGARNFETGFADNSIGLFQLGLTSFNFLVTKLGSHIREAGKDTSGYMAIAVKGQQLDRIANIAGKLLKGEQSAPVTITRIQMEFRSILGA